MKYFINSWFYPQVSSYHESVQWTKTGSFLRIHFQQLIDLQSRILAPTHQIINSSGQSFLSMLIVVWNSVNSPLNLISRNCLVFSYFMRFNYFKMNFNGSAEDICNHVSELTLYLLFWNDLCTYHFGLSFHFKLNIHFHSVLVF